MKREYLGPIQRLYTVNRWILQPALIFGLSLGMCICGQIVEYLHPNFISEFEVGHHETATFNSRFLVPTNRWVSIDLAVTSGQQHVNLAETSYPIISVEVNGRQLPVKSVSPTIFLSGQEDGLTYNQFFAEKGKMYVVKVNATNIDPTFQARRPRVVIREEFDSWYAYFILVMFGTSTGCYGIILSLIVLVVNGIRRWLHFRRTRTGE